MAERTPFEDVVRKAYDANVRYWETVGRATSDYVQAVSRLWAEAPLTWTPGVKAPPTPNEPPAPADSQVPAALVLEGRAGAEARAVVMLTNEIGRDVEAVVAASVIVGPDGEPMGLRIRTDPEVVKLAPGSRVPVTLMIDLTDTLTPGAEYRGEVNVPGLSPRGLPVVVRRLE